MRNQLFPDGVSAAEMDRRTGRWVEEQNRQTGKREAEGKAACALARLVPYTSLRAVIRSLLYHRVPDTNLKACYGGGGGPKYLFSE